jgi:hypothetical protein
MTAANAESAGEVFNNRRHNRDQDNSHMTREKFCLTIGMLPKIAGEGQQKNPEDTTCNAEEQKAVVDHPAYSGDKWQMSGQ